MNRSELSLYIEIPDRVYFEKWLLCGSWDRFKKFHALSIVEKEHRYALVHCEYLRTFVLSYGFITIKVH